MISQIYCETGVTSVPYFGRQTIELISSSGAHQRYRSLHLDNFGIVVFLAQRFAEELRRHTPNSIFQCWEYGYAKM